MPTIQAIYMSDTNDKPIATSEVGGRTLAQQGGDALKDDGEISITMRTDPLDGFNKLFMVTEVTINKKKSAVLTVVFRTDDIVAVVQDYTGLDETGETVVSTKDNVSLFPLRFDTDAGLHTSVASLGLNTNTDTLRREALDYRGKEVLVVGHSVGLTNWVIATKIDRDEAFAPIIALRNTLIVIVLVVSLIIVFVALFFTRLFTRPILRIIGVSERIGKGELTAQIDLKRRDEIGVLAQSINAMGTNLSELVGNIESQRQRLQVILDSTTEGIVAIDENARVILANKATQGLLQVSPESLVGKNMNEIFNWKQKGQDFKVDYSASGVRTYPQLQFVDNTKTQRYAKLIVAQVNEITDQSEARAIVTIHDETSSRELEDMKTDFVAMAAHELRTPLAAIRGYLEVALYKDAHPDNEKVDVVTYVRQALKNVADLGWLLNNLLDVTRIERGTFTLNMEKVDMADVTDSIVRDTQFAARDKHIFLSYDGPKKGRYVVADFLAVHEVVNNLLSNAIKYTESGGRVSVHFREEGDMYAVDVRDSGVGIPLRAREHLFTKFYRVNGGLDSGNTGTGLGLFIAKSIAERHHGDVSVESEEGAGSTFTFKLPVFSEERLTEVDPKDGQGLTNLRRKRGWVTKNISR